MLPREADAAVHLHAEVGALVGRRQRRARRRSPRRTRTGRRRRPLRGAASHTAAVASSVATAMLAQWCLTAWNMAIGRPNCWRTLAYSAARSVHSRATPTASAASSRRAMSTSARRAPGSRSPRRTVERDTAGAAGRVEVRRHLDRHAGALGVDDGDVVADRHEDDVGQAGAEHRPRRAGQRAAAGRDVTAEGDGPERRAAGQAGQQPRRDLVAADRGEHRAGDQRRHERTRREATAQLLDDDHRLRQPVAGAAELLGHVQPEPAEIGGLLVERRVGLLVGLQQAPAPRRATGA